MTDKKTRMLTSAGIAACVLFGYGDAVGAPTGGEVTGGTGTISQPNATTTRIDQASNKLAIDWSTFDVAANETVQFVQPSAQAIALNRILDQKASQIFGAIDANGRVFLINPNGVVFGRDSHINVAGLVASSLDMSSADFMAGRYSLEARDGSEGGLVANHGVIETTPGGFVVLTGGAVINDGVVLAELGSITLAAGHKATLDFQGDGMLLFEVDQALTEKLAGVDAAVTNTGQLIANGGRILLTAQAASDVYSRVVNNEGIARANRIDDSGGVIRLVGTGGETNSSGLLDASGAGDASSGGTVEVLGDDVTVTGLINADASGTGNGGNVTVIATDTTTFTGHISARGGVVAGDGGFAEVSGDHLAVSGHADLTAPNGDNGGLLLDPGSVAIVDGDDTDPGAALDSFNDGWIEAQLQDGDLSINTTASTNGAAQDITVDSDVSIDWGADNANELTLNAGHDITLGGTFDMQNDGTLTLLFGQAGAATLDLAGATLSGTATATGGTGQDTLVGDTTYTITGANSGTSGSLTSWSSIGNLTGTTGDDTFTVTGGGLDGTLDGLGGNDTLVGQTSYTIDGADSGSSSHGGGPPNAVDWTDIENLTGTSGGDTFTFTAALTGTASGLGGNDTFNVNDGGSAGSFDGGAGTGDEVTYEGSTGSVTVSIANLVGIETLTGSAFEDELQGTSGADTFATTGTDAGTVGGVAYSSFETLNGLGGADIFNLNDDVTIDVVGGAGADTFNLTAGVQIGGTLVGGSESDTLVAVGGGGPNVWTINAANAGTLGVRAFTGIENLTGNANVDQFTFTAALTGTASGLGGDDSFAINNGGSAGTFNGGAGTNDTQTYAGSTGPVTISITNLVGIEALTGSASANDVLQGTGGADTFATAAGTNAGTVGGVTYSSFENLQGLGGADIFNLNNNVSGTVAGGAGTDTFNLGAGVAVGGLDGGSEADTLVAVGGAGPNVWTINAANAGTLGARSFTSMENLTGNGSVDQFTFTAALTGTAAGAGGDDLFTINDGGSAGTFDGGANNDTQTYAGSTGPVTISIANLVAIELLTGSASANDVLQGTTGADTFTTLGAGGGSVGGVIYTSFENLNGLGGSDTLANDTTYAITGPNSGTSTSTTTWSNIENLTGTGGADTFTFTGALSGTASGLAGDDTFAINDGGSAGTFNGGANTDTQTYAGSTGPVTISIASLTAIETLIGSGANDVLLGTGADDTFTAAGPAAGALAGVNYTSFENLDGLGGSDTLANDTSYTITGPDSGTSNSATTWSSIENLTGTGVADTFAFAGGGSLSGVINGLGGNDAVDYSAAATPVTVTLGANLQNVETLAGGGAGFTLAGGAEWTITGADSGTVDGITFANWAGATGTAGADTFTVAGGTLSGTANGAGGTDNLSGDTAYTITGPNSGTGLAVTAWSNIESLTGTAGADTFALAGGTLSGAVNGAGGIDTLSGSTTYTISGVDSGTANGVGPWSNIENLTGSGGGDTFTVSGGTLSGTADGGAGVDTLVGATSYTITGPNSGSSNAVAAWANIENLTGTGAADTFTVASGGSLGGTMNGLGGTDTLAGPNVATTWSVTGTGAGSLAGGTTGAFNNVETLQGNADVDTFNLAGNVIANGGDGNDVFNVTSGTGVIAGEGGSDTVAAAGTFTITGIGGGTAAGRTFSTMELLSGTGTNDTIMGPSGANTWVLSGLNGGSITGGAVIAFDGIDAIDGGGGADAFNLDPTFNGSMNIDGSPTSTLIISSTGSAGDEWNFDSFDTVDFGPGVILNIGTFSLTSVVTQAGTGTTPLVWTAGMDVTLGGTTVNTLFFIGNTPELPFTKANDFAVTNVSLANAALNDNALTANNNAVEEVDWAQFDPNLRLFDVNNPGVKLPADQVVDELALFWFDDEEEDEIDIAQATSPRTLVGLESRRN